jgi:hypothetical protein
MSSFRICQNPTSTLLRETFHATPVTVPEERYKPLMLMTYDGKETKFLGEMKFLFVPGQPFNVKVSQSVVADASLEKTSVMNLNVGLNILNGFFKGLKMDPIALSTAFHKVKKISLSFTNVKRDFIDVLDLGNQLSKQSVNLKNPALELFKVNKDTELLLITDALVSPGFSINDDTKKDGGLNIDVPLIEKYISDGKVDVKMSSDKKSTISFEL